MESAAPGGAAGGGAVKIQVLGCHSASLQGERPPCFRLGQSLLLEAGAATSGLAVEEQYKIDHVLLSRADLGHLQTLAFLADNVIGFRKGAVQVHTSQAVVDAIYRDFFNDKVWPDFSKIPTPADPVVRFCVHAAGEAFEAGGLQVEFLPLDALGRPEGFIVGGPGVALAYLATRAPRPSAWDRLKNATGIAALLLGSDTPAGRGKERPGGQGLGDLSEGVRSLSPEVAVYLPKARPGREAENSLAARLGSRTVRQFTEGETLDLGAPSAGGGEELGRVHIAEPASSERERGRGPAALAIDAGNTQAQRQMFDRFGRSFRAGERIFEEGERSREMFVVQEGQVKLYKMIRGERRVIETLGTGEFFGEMAILNSKPRSLTAEAVTDVRVLIFPPDTFEGLIVSNAGLAHRIIRTLAGRLENADNHIENLLYQDAESKVINGLLKSVEDHGIPDTGGMRVSLSPAELAEKVGLPVGQVKRAIRKLADSGILQAQGKGLLITDLAKLEKTLSFLGLRHELGLRW